MKLETYLKDKRIPQNEFARSIDVSPATVNRWIKSNRRPNWVTMERIKEVTGGRVKPNDFLNGGEK